LAKLAENCYNIDPRLHPDKEPLLAGDDPKIAAQCLEQLLQSNERDTMTMAQLVIAYARYLRMETKFHQEPILRSRVTMSAL
jgi:hypothetical protein